MPFLDTIRKVDRFIQVKDETDGRPVDRWTSPDILPVLPKNRTFGTSDYASYWVSGAVCASFWAMGGSAIANGLSAGEAIGAMLIGTLICAAVAYLCGKPGIKYHLGFPIQSRATFGMYGSYFVVVIKCFTNFLYCGIQSYWGGLAVHVMLAAIFPSYHNMKNTLPESANITTADLIGTVLYMLVFWAVLWIRPHKMYVFFKVSFCAVLITIITMFVWAMAANGGAGDLVSPTKQLSSSETFFVFIQTIGVLCGSFTGASIRHSDWSRYAKSPKSPLLGIWVVGPLALTTTAMFGVFVTSAARSMYGEILWQPISLLIHIQKVNYSASARAGTFFGGLGWFLSQLAVNVSLNSVAAGMDLTSVAPKYLNARRGAYLLACVGFVVCPWNYVNSPSTFTTVLSSFGLFISPLIGMYMADFWLVRHQNWKVPDLFIGNERSVYWYTKGFNLRGFGTWISIIWLSLPGFAFTIAGSTSGRPWKRIFQLTFFVGLIGGFVIYTAVCYVLPIKDARVHQDYDWSSEKAVALEGADVDVDEEKGAKGLTTSLSAVSDDKSASGEKV